MFQVPCHTMYDCSQERSLEWGASQDFERKVSYVDHFGVLSVIYFWPLSTCSNGLLLVFSQNGGVCH